MENKTLTPGSPINPALEGLLDAAPTFYLCSLLPSHAGAPADQPPPLWTAGQPPPPPRLCPRAVSWSDPCTWPLPPPRCGPALTFLLWGCDLTSELGGFWGGGPVSCSPFPGAALGQGRDCMPLPASRTSIYLPQSHFPQKTIKKASDGVKRGNFKALYSWLTFDGCKNKVCFVGNKPFRRSQFRGAVCLTRLSA